MTDPSLLEREEPKGALSLDRAVKTYLSLTGFDDSIVDIKTDVILARCQQGLEEVGPSASKRGPKGTLVLWRFLQSIETAAKLSKGPTTLPSDSIREKFGPGSTTPLFDFGRKSLKIAITKGKAAIGAVSLADGERSDAEKMLSRLDSYTSETQKSNGALLSQWRAVHAKAKTEDTAN